MVLEYYDDLTKYQKDLFTKRFNFESPYNFLQKFQTNSGIIFEYNTEEQSNRLWSYLKLNKSNLLTGLSSEFKQSTFNKPKNNNLPVFEAKVEYEPHDIENLDFKGTLSCNLNNHNIEAKVEFRPYDYCSLRYGGNHVQKPDNDNKQQLNIFTNALFSCNKNFGIGLNLNVDLYKNYFTELEFSLQGKFDKTKLVFSHAATRGILINSSINPLVLGKLSYSLFQIINDRLSIAALFNVRFPQCIGKDIKSIEKDNSQKNEMAIAADQKLDEHSSIKVKYESSNAFLFSFSHRVQNNLILNLSGKQMPFVNTCSGKKYKFGWGITIE